MDNILTSDSGYYIDWNNYVSGKKIEVANNKTGVIWQDVVTKTWFSLPYGKYNEYIGQIVEIFGGKLNSQVKIEGHFDYERIKNFNNIDNFSILKSLPWKDVKSHSKPAVVDVCRLFVLFAWLYGEVDKESRVDAYKSFFEGTFTNYPKAYNAIKVLCNNGDETSVDDKEILLIKGGAFKIKKYYLENSKIHDIRGASTIIKHLMEEIIPQEISNFYIEESIIYSGGGNLFAVVDMNLEKADDIIGRSQKLFDEYAITLENVFCHYKSSISKLIKNFKEEMKAFDSEIEQKKKMKIYNDIHTESALLNKSIKIGNQEIKIEYKELINDGSKKACERCNVRDALYKIDTPDGTECVCGSCFHKFEIGRKCKPLLSNEMQRYIKKLCIRTNEQISSFSRPQIIEDLKDSKGYIAVIYGDGNNFGKIVKSLNNLYEMMYFSRMVYSTAFEATCKAILDSNCIVENEGKKVNPFELIALGGDDIFLICPAENSMYLSNCLISEFNKKFRKVIALGKDEYKENYEITLSIGIAVGKYNNPVRNLFDMSESKLLCAKRKERDLAENNKNSGSIDITIVKGTSYLEISNDYSIFPMDNNSFGALLKLIKDMKNDDIKKSRIFNFVKAKEQMEEYAEFQLYFLYNESKQKDKKRLTKRMKSYFENDMYSFEAGVVVKKISEYVEKKVRCNVWKDIIDVWDFCEGGENL